MTWRTESRPCPICGSARARLLGARGGRAHHAGKGVLTSIVRCRDCHGVYQRPTLVPEFNPYEEHEPADYFQLHDVQRKVAAGESLAAFAESYLGRPGRMLELGCGRGELLRGAANRGWMVQGIEMTPAFAAFAHEQYRIDVECAPVEAANSLEDSYDVILLAAILEHLYTPLETLQRVRRSLRHGGLIFIDVPNECSLMAALGNAYMRARRRDWAVNLSPTFSPYHVVGFCPTSLRYLLELTGFRAVAFELHRWNNVLPRRPGLLAACEHVALDVTLSVGQWLGMGAGITCWATAGASNQHPPASTEIGQ
jgi:SAM-dependent methyltransferase